MKSAVIALAMLSATIVAAASSARAVEPTLEVVRAQPLVVAGAGFAPGERVVVAALTSLGVRETRVRAGAAGSFRARLGSFSQPCGKPFAVRARGVDSARVALARLAARPCVPPPTK